MFVIRQAGPSRLVAQAARTAIAPPALLAPTIRATRSHSSHSGARASDAYESYIPSPNNAKRPEGVNRAATETTPTNLTPEQKDLLERIIRVDQAGELGANWIYRGQKLGSTIRGDKKTAKEVEGMWESEKRHLHVLRQVQVQHGVRPTLLWPLWQGMAFTLGLGTSLMGREAAMACTEAVETVIGEHYDDQLRALKPLIAGEGSSDSPSSSTLQASSTAAAASSSASDGSFAPHPSLPLMTKILEEFRDDELEHLDAAVEGGAQKAPGHSLLSAVIGMGCKAAIKVCERV